MSAVIITSKLFGRNKRIIHDNFGYSIQNKVKHKGEVVWNSKLHYSNLHSALRRMVEIAVLAKNKDRIISLNEYMNEYRSMLDEFRGEFKDFN